MSDPNVEMVAGADSGASTLLAQVAAAEGAAYRGLSGAIDDLFLPDAARLDDRTRTGVARLLRALVATVEGQVRGHAVRQLQGQGATALADRLCAAPPSFATLADAGLLRDRALMAELIAQVQLDQLAAALPVEAHDEAERPSLINRFVAHPDRLLAQSAMAVLVAESRRRGLADAGPLPQTDLPAELHHQLVWGVAAALRRECGAGAEIALDRALADAAQRSLIAHDEGERVEAAVMKLAVAIDARPGELPDLLVEALGDRRATLFAALIAHGLGVDYMAARALTVEPDGARLWVALRALGLERAAIARIGVALAQADPRRDVETFAERLDAIMAVDAAAASAALASLRLPGDYRAALVALSGEGAA